ncbi:hypothetical protein KBC85_03260 [Candidatus Saccharibacteria bacterium]|nr:hypothetical protein [Candidatus Saccharibacteria bacterium]MDQ5885111.1 hypothetical protein [Patescibacteria group bacterium]MDQ5953428.1 hypothetical protein [Patescibacteria group bacterium]MDQ5958565.1 hypothetical protein [Patescibacteria group bacterium]
MKKHIKRISYDFVGISLIILSALLGWLPGPGGIPLLIAGLAILSVHNKWAHNILVFVKKNADSFFTAVFPNNKKIRILHTMVALFLFGLAIFIYIYLDNPYKIMLSIPIVAIAIFQITYANRFIINKH